MDSDVSGGSHKKILICIFGARSGRLCLICPDSSGVVVTCDLFNMLSWGAVDEGYEEPDGWVRFNVVMGAEDSGDTSKNQDASKISKRIWELMESKCIEDIAEHSFAGSASCSSSAVAAKQLVSRRHVDSDRPVIDCGRSALYRWSKTQNGPNMLHYMELHAYEM